MKHKYNITNILSSALAARGTFYPGMLIPGLDNTGYVQPFGQYPITGENAAPKMITDKGSPLRKAAAEMGVYYFLPVEVNGVELPNAVMSLSQAKIIAKTQMPGANGSVKEYISLDDMTIDLTAVLIGDDGNYPEGAMEQISNLWRLNEAVEIVSALSDIMLPAGTKVVLEELTIDPVGEYEDVQTISLRLTSDEVFELELQ